LEIIRRFGKTSKLSKIKSLIQEGNFEVVRKFGKKSRYMLKKMMHPPLLI